MVAGDDNNVFGRATTAFLERHLAKRWICRRAGTNVPNDRPASVFPAPGLAIRCYAGVPPVDATNNSSFCSIEGIQLITHAPGEWPASHATFRNPK